MWEHFSLDWYRAIFRDPQILEGTWNSVVIALWATVLSTVIGTLCAYGLWKRSSRVLTGALYLSLVTPEIVTGISLLALFQWAFRWLHWQLGMYTVVLAHVAFSHRLRGDRGLGATAHRQPRARRGRHGSRRHRVAGLLRT